MANTNLPTQDTASKFQAPPSNAKSPIIASHFRQGNTLNWTRPTPPMFGAASEIQMNLELEAE